MNETDARNRLGTSSCDHVVGTSETEGSVHSWKERVWQGKSGESTLSFHPIQASIPSLHTFISVSGIGIVATDGELAAMVEVHTNPSLGVAIVAANGGWASEIFCSSLFSSYNSH